MIGRAEACWLRGLKYVANRSQPDTLLSQSISPSVHHASGCQLPLDVGVCQTRLMQLLSVRHRRHRYRSPVGVVVGGVLVTVLASCSSSSYTRATDWDVVTVSDQSIEIRVWVGGGCDRLQSVTATETSDSVDITAQVHHSGGSCTMPLNTAQKTVQLQGPLGSRSLTGCRPPHPAQQALALSGQKRTQPGPNCGAGH